MEPCVVVLRVVFALSCLVGACACLIGRSLVVESGEVVGALLEVVGGVLMGKACGLFGPMLSLSRGTLAGLGSVSCVFRPRGVSEFAAECLFGTSLVHRCALAGQLGAVAGPLGALAGPLRSIG
jgi:hypothetical protein